LANLLYLGAVAVVSLASLFFYSVFARWLGQPFDAILLLNPWLVRGMMLGGFLVYGLASAGCILMYKGRRKGFWWYAIPVFLIITASLFVVFNPINLVQLSLLVFSVIALSMLTKFMK
jgi:cobalamin synthase